jgi:quinol monooxygenase YgiN
VSGTIDGTVPAGMVVVAGTIGFESQDARDGAVAASVELQRSTRDTEPGCLAYVFAADPVDPTVVQVYELWQDTASLATHFAHPNYGAMRAILRQFPRSGASVTAKHLVAATAPVYGATGAPSASFD